MLKYQILLGMLMVAHGAKLTQKQEMEDGNFLNVFLEKVFSLTPKFLVLTLFFIAGSTLMYKM